MEELIKRKETLEALILWAGGYVLGFGGFLLFFLLRSKFVLFMALAFLGALILLVWDLVKYRKVLNSIPTERDKSLLRALQDSLFSSKNKPGKSA